MAANSGRIRIRMGIEAMSAILTDLDILKIEMEAVRRCCNRSNFDPLRAPGEQMVDNDYRHGIREEFASVPEWEDWMVEPLLTEVKRHIAFRAQMDELCSATLGNIGSFIR